MPHKISFLESKYRVVVPLIMMACSQKRPNVLDYYSSISPLSRLSSGSQIRAQMIVMRGKPHTREGQYLMIRSITNLFYTKNLSKEASLSQRLMRRSYCSFGPRIMVRFKIIECLTQANFCSGLKIKLFV